MNQLVTISLIRESYTENLKKKETNILRNVKKVNPIKVWNMQKYTFWDKIYLQICYY